MRNENTGLSVHLRENTAEGRHALWMDMAVLAVFAAGLSLICAEVLPSSGLSWWGFFLPVLVIGIILLNLYNAKFGRWVLPAGLAAVVLISLIGRKAVMGGLGVLGDDLLQLYTKRFGKVTLGFVKLI